MTILYNISSSVCVENLLTTQVEETLRRCRSGAVTRGNSRLCVWYYREGKHPAATRDGNLKLQLSCKCSCYGTGSGFQFSCRENENRLINLKRCGTGETNLKKPCYNSSEHIEWWYKPSLAAGLSKEQYSKDVPYYVSQYRFDHIQAQMSLYEFGPARLEMIIQPSIHIQSWSASSYDSRSTAHSKAYGHLT